MKRLNLLFKFLVQNAALYAFSLGLHAQTPRLLNEDKSLFLEGKTFMINVQTFDQDPVLTDVTFPDEITFAGGKLHSKKLRKEFGYIADTYSTRTDEAGNTAFIAFTKDEEGDIDIFWKGFVAGNSIKGTMHWFSRGATRSFTGDLKYKSHEK